MAGLNANVTLGPGVVPIRGQISMPAGSDEVSFGDAFAEAQAARLDAVDARDAAVRQVESAPADRPARLAAEPLLPEADARPAAAPIWPPTSRSAAPAREDARAVATTREISGAPGAAATSGKPGVRAGSKLSARGSTPKTGPRRSVRRGQSEDKAARASAADAHDDSLVGAALAAAPTQTEAGTGSGGPSTDSTSGGNDAAAVGAVDAIGGASGAAAPTAAGGPASAASTARSASSAVSASSAATEPAQPTTSAAGAAQATVPAPAAAAISSAGAAEATAVLPAAAPGSRATPSATIAGAAGPAFEIKGPPVVVPTLGHAPADAAAHVPSIASAASAAVPLASSSPAPAAVASPADAAANAQTPTASVGTAQAVSAGPSVTASEAGPVPTVAGLPGAPGTAAGTGVAGAPGALAAAFPGTLAAAFPGTGPQVPSNWASAAVPVIVKSPSGSAQANSASISGRAVAQGGSVQPVAPQAGAPAPRSPAGSADSTSGAATPATPATSATSATSATPATPAAAAAATTPPPDAATVADAARLMPRVIRRGGPSFATAAYASEGSVTAATTGRSTGLAPVAGAASTGPPAGGSDGSSSTSQSETAKDAVVANTPGASATGGNASASAAASAVSGAAVVAGSASRAAQAETVVGDRSPVDLADAADRLMNQAVQTIHTYRTAAGPSLEARISDPSFGDVRLVVTGRAGEIVQAQLVVRDRIAADAITAAVARMHASGDALAGVSVTVRSEGGGSATNGRAGGYAFEAAGWAAGNGYGAGGESRSGDGSRETQKPAPVALPDAARPNRPMPRMPLPGGQSLDVRA